MTSEDEIFNGSARLRYRVQTQENVLRLVVVTCRELRDGVLIPFQ